MWCMWCGVILIASEVVQKSCQQGPLAFSRITTGTTFGLVELDLCLIIIANATRALRCDAEWSPHHTQRLRPSCTLLCACVRVRVCFARGRGSRRALSAVVAKELVAILADDKTEKLWWSRHR